jgi:hypothetical protein
MSADRRAKCWDRVVFRTNSEFETLAAAVYRPKGVAWSAPAARYYRPPNVAGGRLTWHAHFSTASTWLEHEDFG